MERKTCTSTAPYVAGQPGSWAHPDAKEGDSTYLGYDTEAVSYSCPHCQTSFSVERVIPLRTIDEEGYPGFEEPGSMALG